MGEDAVEAARQRRSCLPLHNLCNCKSCRFFQATAVAGVPARRERYELCLLKDGHGGGDGGSNAAAAVAGNGSGNGNGANGQSGGGNSSGDRFQFSRCLRPLPAASMRRLGVPLPAAELEVLHTNLGWEEIRVRRPRGGWLCYRNAGRRTKHGGMKKPGVRGRWGVAGVTVTVTCAPCTALVHTHWRPRMGGGWCVARSLAEWRR